MLSSTALRPPAPTPAVSSLAHPTIGASAARSVSAGRRATMTVVYAVRDYGSIPKREPFSLRRSILDEFLRQEKPLVQRTKDEITDVVPFVSDPEPTFEDYVDPAVADYCTTIEGDECCSCWDAYFELNKLEQELPKDDIARMVKDSEGNVRYLIDSIHQRSNSRKKMAAEKARNSVSPISMEQTAKPRRFPVPDGLPKPQEELDEEAEALMPESSYTRLLRRMGRYPDWYTPRPDHETD